MKNFIVQMKEIHYNSITVETENEKDAIEKANLYVAQNGCPDDALEYSHTAPESEWIVTAE